MEYSLAGRFGRMDPHVDIDGIAGSAVDLRANQHGSRTSRPTPACGSRSAQHVAELPWFADYPEQSGRTIPVVRLTPEDGASRT
jgi:hypothetical protein